jgi:hypothetical protein
MSRVNHAATAVGAAVTKGRETEGEEERKGGELPKPPMIKTEGLSPNVVGALCPTSSAIAVNRSRLSRRTTDAFTGGSEQRLIVGVVVLSWDKKSTFFFF